MENEGKTKLKYSDFFKSVNLMRKLQKKGTELSKEEREELQNIEKFVDGVCMLYENFISNNG